MLGYGDESAWYTLLLVSKMFALSRKHFHLKRTLKSVYFCTFILLSIRCCYSCALHQALRYTLETACLLRIISTLSKNPKCPEGTTACTLPIGCPNSNSKDRYLEQRMPMRRPTGHDRIELLTPKRCTRGVDEVKTGPHAL